MAAEPLALSTVPPPATAAADYDAICAAVTATARGRWFLEEFAKRNRNSDTNQVLAAIARMEATIAGERARQASEQATQEVRIELLEIARTIAQTRAEVAESRPAAQPQPAEASASNAAPDVAAAAERLRQIAWTLRACGVDLPASEQIGEIAEAILSADALRNLGEQRAQKLTEALHYLEHRIDRMLDGQQPASEAIAAVEPAGTAPSPQPHGDEPNEATLATVAVAMIAAAMKPEAGETTPVQAAPLQAAPLEAAPAPPAAMAAMAPPDDIVIVSDAAEYSMDDDVVLTVAVEDAEPGPAVAAPSVPEPTAVASIEPVAEPIAAEPPAEAIAGPAQDEWVELEVEPLRPAPPSADHDADESRFIGLELEPLAVSHAAASLPPAEPHAAEVSEPDTGANDNRPLMLVTEVTAASAEPADDAIAMQVDQDLGGLADNLSGDRPNETPGDSAVTAADAVASATAPAPQEQPAQADDAHEHDPDELLEPPPRGAPVSALVASAQVARAQLTDTLAAIESELFGSTRPDAHANPPESIPAPAAAKPAATKPTSAPAQEGPLTALMAMSEDERIAMFS